MGRLNWKNRLPDPIFGQNNRFYNLVDKNGNIITQDVKFVLKNTVAEDKEGTPVHAANLNEAFTYIYTQVPANFYGGMRIYTWLENGDPLPNCPLTISVTGTGNTVYNQQTDDDGFLFAYFPVAGEVTITGISPYIGVVAPTTIVKTIIPNVMQRIDVIFSEVATVGTIYAITTSQLLRFTSKVKKIDVVVVAAGGGGGDGFSQKGISYYGAAGSAGAGGEVLTFNGIDIIGYDSMLATIGAGGGRAANGGDTSVQYIGTAKGGKAGANATSELATGGGSPYAVGGTGGKAGQHSTNAPPGPGGKGQDGVWIWNNYKQLGAAGGGGAGAYDSYMQGAAPGVGGIGGGGNGGDGARSTGGSADSNAGNGGNGSPNTGSGGGGGGGGCGDSTTKKGNGGLGGSGVIYIRIAEVA